MLRPAYSTPAMYGYDVRQDPKSTGLGEPGDGQRKSRWPAAAAWRLNATGFPSRVLTVYGCLQACFSVRCLPRNNPALRRVSPPNPLSLGVETSPQHGPQHFLNPASLPASLKVPAQPPPPWSCAYSSNFQTCKNHITPRYYSSFHFLFHHFCRAPALNPKFYILVVSILFYTIPTKPQYTLSTKPEILCYSSFHFWLYWGSVGVLLGLHVDNGKENGNYHNIL